MKQPENVLDGASVESHLNEILAVTKARLGSLARNISDGAARFMMAMRVSRMTSALTALSDEQLDQIGVLRKDINRHARKLIIYEYDGL